MTTPQDSLKTITIKDALAALEGTPIPRITGKVSLVWNRTGTKTKWGEGSRQSGLIEDEQSNKILFTVWDKPDMTEFKGRTVIFRSSGGKKTSIEIKADFKDASKMTLNVGKSAFVLTEEEDTDDIDYSPSPLTKSTTSTDGFDYKTATEAAKSSKSTPKAIVEPKKAIPENGVDIVKHRVMQITNLRKICNDAALSICPGINNMEYVKEIATSIFIQATRENLHDKLPNSKPISKVKEDVEAEPEFLPAEEF